MNPDHQIEQSIINSLLAERPVREVFDICANTAPQAGQLWVPRLDFATPEALSYTADPDAYPSWFLFLLPGESSGTFTGVPAFCATELADDTHLVFHAPTDGLRLAVSTHEKIPVRRRMLKACCGQVSGSLWNTIRTALDQPGTFPGPRGPGILGPADTRLGWQKHIREGLQHLETLAGNILIFPQPTAVPFRRAASLAAASPQTADTRIHTFSLQPENFTLIVSLDAAKGVCEALIVDPQGNPSSDLDGTTLCTDEGVALPFLKGRLQFSSTLLAASPRLFRKDGTPLWVEAVQGG